VLREIVVGWPAIGVDDGTRFNHDDRLRACLTATDTLLDAPDVRLVDLDGATKAVRSARTIARRILWSQVQAVS
jgi:hypothetical protein